MGLKGVGRREFLVGAAKALAVAPVLSSLREAWADKPGRAVPKTTHPTAAAKPIVKLNVRDFGVKGDGTTVDTVALQETIDRVWVLGGGEVLVPAGTYLTGAI